MTAGDSSGREAPNFHTNSTPSSRPGAASIPPGALGELPVRAGVSTAALETVDLPAKRREALRWVTLYPGRSARELERASGLRKINARLSELEAQGVVEGRGYTTCSVTGRVATAWKPTGLAPRPLVRKPTTLQRLRAAEIEVQQLRAALSVAQAQLRAMQVTISDAPVWGRQ